MFCTQCGLESKLPVRFCVGCGAPTDPSEAARSAVQPAARDPFEELSLILPVNVSGYAIAAGYLGLLSPTLIVAPFAILFGILGLRHVKRRPELRGRVRSWFGIIAGVLGMAMFVLLMIPVLMS